MDKGSKVVVMSARRSGVGGLRLPDEFILTESELSGCNAYQADAVMFLSRYR